MCDTWWVFQMFGFLQVLWFLPMMMNWLEYFNLWPKPDKTIHWPWLLFVSLLNYIHIVCFIVLKHWTEVRTMLTLDLQFEPDSHWSFSIVDCVKIIQTNQCKGEFDCQSISTDFLIVKRTAFSLLILMFCWMQFYFSFTYMYAGCFSPGFNKIIECLELFCPHQKHISCSCSHPGKHFKHSLTSNETWVFGLIKNKNKQTQSKCVMSAGRVRWHHASKRGGCKHSHGAFTDSRSAGEN